MTDVDTFIATIGPDLVQAGPQYWRARDEVAVNYPTGEHQISREVEEASFWFAHRNRCVVSLLRRLAPSGPLLDVGGGNGFVSLALAAAGHQPIVMEPRAEAVRVARARKLPVIAAALGPARLVPESVPAAGLFDVLEHNDDEHAMLAELRRVLQPGGRLYITVPAYGWLWSQADVEACHVRRYRLSSLRAALERAGFDLEFSTYMFGPLVGPILVMRTIPWMIGLNSWPGRPSTADHQAPSGAMASIITARLDAEYASIDRGSAASVGSSIMVAARASGRSAGEGRSEKIMLQ
jgi:SAM-dependent methyltransferase